MLKTVAEAAAAENNERVPVRSLPPRLLPANLMSFDWQQIVTLLIVLAAMLYLGRRVWRLVAMPGCGGCGSCAANSSNKAASPGAMTGTGPALISIESVVRSAQAETTRQETMRQETTQPGVAETPGCVLD